MRMLAPALLLLLLLPLPMPVLASASGFQSAAGVLITNTATGNQSVSGLTFTPKFVLFKFTGQTTQNTANTAATIGFGAAVSSSNRFALYARRNLNSTNTDSRHSGSACIEILDSAFTVAFSADFVSMDSTGFTINVTTGNAAQFFVYWMAFGGTDLRAGIKQFDSPIATGSAAWTGMGFKPNVLIFATAGMTATIPTTDGNMRMGFGWATATQQAGLGQRNVTAANTSRRSQSTASAIYIPDTSAMWLDAAVTSLDSDGATINWTTVQSSAVHLWAIGLSGVRGYVGSLSQPASTGNQSITAIERTPTAALFGSVCGVAASGQQNDGIISLGSAVAATQANHAFTTASGGNNTGQANFNNAVISCYTAGTPTLNSQAALSSFDSRGFTINWGTADATARQVVYLTLGPLPLGRMLLTVR